MDLREAMEYLGSLAKTAASIDADARTFGNDPRRLFYRQADGTLAFERKIAPGAVDHVASLTALCDLVAAQGDPTAGTVWVGNDSVVWVADEWRDLVAKVPLRLSAAWRQFEALQNWLEPREFARGLRRLEAIDLTIDQIAAFSNVTFKSSDERNIVTNATRESLGTNVDRRVTGLEALPTAAEVWPDRYDLPGDDAPYAPAEGVAIECEIVPNYQTGKFSLDANPAHIAEAKAEATAAIRRQLAADMPKGILIIEGTPDLPDRD